MVTRACWWLADILARTLEPDERDAVSGDLHESGETGAQALRDMLGLVVRRQAALWKDWRPWLALVSLIVPCALLLGLLSRHTANGSAIYIWMYAGNWDWGFFANSGFRHDLTHYATVISFGFVTLACWAWTIGFVLGSVSRRTMPANAALFCVVLLLVQPPEIGPRRHDNDAVFDLMFYRVIFPLVVQALIALFPALWGMRQSRHLATLRPLHRTLISVAMLAAIAIQAWVSWRYPNVYQHAAIWRQMAVLNVLTCWPVAYLALGAIGRRRLMRAPALLLALAGFAAAADQATVRATLQPAPERKPAPEFALKDSSGKTVTLKKYRGKVVLLDFWATWCHGCKEEIPWFADFELKYSAKGLAVVGVSLDEDGWKVVRPFLQGAKIPYRIVLGNDAIAGKYGIGNMPDTFLIDRRGRIAATYVGLVDKDDVEANIRRILEQ